MLGLWNVKTRGIPPTLATLVWGWLVAVAAISLTISCIVVRRRHWKAARLLYSGFVVLSVYFVLNATDLTNRYYGAVTTYGYILITSLSAAFRTLSDVLVLAGYWQIIRRFQTHTMGNLLSLCWDTKVREYVIMPELLPSGLLWVLGLYQVGLQFALCFAWLGFADLAVIDSIARARSGIEVAFAAIYFIALLLSGFYYYYSYILERDSADSVCNGKPLKNTNHDGVEAARLSLYHSYLGALAAGLALCARSFCELVIVGQLNRWPASILDIYRARDACYGLFSSAFLILIFASLPWKNRHDPWELDDSLTAEKEAAARVKAEKLQSTLQTELNQWPDEAHERFMTKLEMWTRNGQKTAPGIGQLFAALRDDLRSEAEALRSQRELEMSPRRSKSRRGNKSSRDSNEDTRLLDGKVEFLHTLQGHMSDWVPVYKWDGRQNDDIDASQAADDSDAISNVPSTVVGYYMHRSF